MMCMVCKLCGQVIPHQHFLDHDQTSYTKTSIASLIMTPVTIHWMQLKLNGICIKL